MGGDKPLLCKSDLLPTLLHHTWLYDSRGEGSAVLAGWDIMWNGKAEINSNWTDNKELWNNQMHFKQLYII